MSHSDLSPIPALLLFNLVRGTFAVDGTWRDKIARYRAGALDALAEVAAPRHCAHFSVLETDTDLAYEGFDATRSWGGGSVDVVEFTDIDDLLLAYETVLRTQRHRAPEPSWSSHAYATRAFAVRPPGPEAAFRQFSIGGSLPGKTRSEWQEVWREHAQKIPEAAEFEGYLKSYVQYHLVDQSMSGELGIPDMHGIAHMGWTSAEEMDYALSLPDYRSVLRTDEDNLISKSRVVRVLALPDPGTDGQ
jgi:EthD domain